MNDYLLKHKKHIDYLISLALREDIGEGDITTEAIYSGKEHAVAEFIAKEDGIVAGIDFLSYFFQMFDEELEFTPNVEDGSAIHRGQLIATIEGSANTILTGERTALNFLQRMSGIATYTGLLVDQIKHTEAHILDTRKTIPGHRVLDKWAVTLGGGVNHRMRLDDRFLIKENHISVAGGIARAIHACDEFREEHELEAEIEIEITSLNELKEVLEYGEGIVRYVMLDNMSNEDMRKAVGMIHGKFLTEASGNVSIKRVASIAETGVDFISVGAITHSVRGLDISLLFLVD